MLIPSSTLALVEILLKMDTKYGFGFATGVSLLVLIFMPTTTLATARNAGGPGNWHFGFNHTDWAHRNSTIVVGGSEKWHFGFNYSNWALQNCPFYTKDTLVFKYDPPNGTNFHHSVYLLKNFKSYMNCDLKHSKMVGSVTQGGGAGFKFVLKGSKPYYFACGEKAGFHCNTGQMKFFVRPLKAPYRG